MISLNFNLVWDIINVLVLFFLLRHFLIRPITNVMDKRKAMVDQSMVNARDSEAKAYELRDRYREKLAASAEESKALLEDAKAQAKAEQERLLREARLQADRIIENGHRTADADQEKALLEAEAQIAKLVMAAVAKVMKGEMDDAKNQALYDKYIAEAGESHDAGSK